MIGHPRPPFPLPQARMSLSNADCIENGVCLLPKADDHKRRLKMVEKEITEMGGHAVILETVALNRVEDEKVIARFKADRDEQYTEFLSKCKDFEAEIMKESAAGNFTYAALEENDVDLKKLQSWFERIRKLDFYGASLASEAEQRLHDCTARLESYAQRVFDSHDENR